MRENIYLKKYSRRDPVKYPRFVYFPDPVGTGVFEEQETPKICECCKEKTELIYEFPFHSEIYDLEGICPACVASGIPAREKDAEYTMINDTEPVSDPLKTEILIHHTPGFFSYWDVTWRAHCDDYCAYLGTVGYKELKEEGLIEEILSDPLTDTQEWNAYNLRKLAAGGWWTAHMFECLHCGKHLFWIEEDSEARFE